MRGDIDYLSQRQNNREFQYLDASEIGDIRVINPSDMVGTGVAEHKYIWRRVYKEGLINAIGKYIKNTRMLRVSGMINKE